MVICGVSGSGKTTTGRLLSAELGIPFYDADDFHPAANKVKMASGHPLNDEDRVPWLETLADRLPAWENEGGAVLACSALKESYRVRLLANCGESVRWVFLNASEAVLDDRLALRQGHFFNRNLLASQLEALEIPDYGWCVDVESTPQEIVNTILKRLRDE